MLELTVLIISISVILAVLYIKNRQQEQSEQTQVAEGFESYHLSACPPGFQSYYNSDGDVMCCDGEIVANRCLGDRQCTLGANSGNIPNCVEFILSDYIEKAKSQCSISMPNYFEDRTHNISGCTNGSLNDTLTGPKSFKQPTCFNYKSQTDNQNAKDSCYNQRLLDHVPCFGNNCTKEIIEVQKGVPVLIAISFTDTMGIHRTAYTQKSMENFLNATNPNWRSQGIDLTKNIAVAEVAKAYYVDKTLDQSQVQF